MGNARFDADTYRSYSTTHSLDTKSRDQVFTSTSIPQALDPSKIELRESRDSDANPKSTPIILGLDVTGSMGFIAESIAKTQLPEIMNSIYAELPVTDPHLMFMGIGDVHSDRAPLQVSQFEAEAIPLIEQLRSLWLESNGGGNNSESYHLPWYFALTRTAIDSFEKRGHKGYIFTIGDELVPPPLTESQLRRVFGSKGQYLEYSTAELLAKVQERYNVFHIVAEEGSYARSNPGRVVSNWTELLGPNVIRMKDHKDLPAIITATIKIAEGAGIRQVLTESEIASKLEYAFTNALQAA